MEDNIIKSEIKIERRTYIKGKFKGKFIGTFNFSKSDLIHENFYDIEILNGEIETKNDEDHIRHWETGEPLEFEPVEKFLSNLPSSMPLCVEYADGSFTNYSINLRTPKLSNYKLTNQVYEDDKVFGDLEGEISGYLKHFDTEIITTRVTQLINPAGIIETKKTLESSPNKPTIPKINRVASKSSAKLKTKKDITKPKVPIKDSPVELDKLTIWDFIVEMFQLFLFIFILFLIVIAWRITVPLIVIGLFLYLYNILGQSLRNIILWAGKILGFILLLFFIYSVISILFESSNDKIVNDNPIVESSIDKDIYDDQTDLFSELSDNDKTNIDTNNDDIEKSLNNNLNKDKPLSDKSIYQKIIQSNNSYYSITLKTSLRDGPSSKYKVLQRIDVGEKVILLENHNEWWSRVEFNGQQGWVKRKLLTLAYDIENY